MNYLLPSLAALLLSVATLPILAASSPVQRGEQLDIQLLSERTAIKPGESHWFAVRIQHDPHWHTYWINPGDSGLATRIRWSLPEGFVADDIVWPYPRRLPIGPLVNFGYEGETWLLSELRAPERLPTDAANLSFTAEVDYLVCEVECVPGKNTLTLKLPVDGEGEPAADLAAAFGHARTLLPTAHADLGGHVAERNGDLEIVLTGSVPERFELFPIQDGLFDNQAFAAWQQASGTWATRHGRSDWYAGLPDRVPMLLVDTSIEPPRAYSLDLVTNTDDGATTDAVDASATLDNGQTDASAGTGVTSLALALLLAFAGGVILNLMPCVFPVLSMKAMSLAQAGGNGGRARRDGRLYTLGALVSFAVIGAALLALRAGGEQIGWGFQLQSPWLVAALAYLIVALGLSLSGAITVGSSWMNLGQRLTEGGGDRAAFFTGVLACVVAAPCTAPFMGAALGFALTQPVPAAMSVFLALGLGLAAPLAALAHVPALARHLPRPGPWMETFKQVLAFPMYLVAAWLLWVLALQTGANGVGIALIGLVCLAFGLWLWQRVGVQAGTTTRVIAAAAILASLALLPLPQQFGGPQDARAGDIDTERWQAWSPERLSELRGAGEPVLVNMTAAWCITCLANERVALSSDDFYRQMRELRITYLKGDWTNHDERVTSYLAQFGRAGVPIYVLYPRGNGAPEILPQLLTPGIVRAALARAAGL